MTKKEQEKPCNDSILRACYILDLFTVENDKWILRDIAAKEGLVCLDLAKIQQQKLEAIGEEAAGRLYRFDPKKKRIDPSHTNLAGAEFVAEIIANELKKSTCPLKKELK